MRTTITIDDDVLDHARVLANHEDRPLGAVVSDLMRRALTRPETPPLYRNGLRLLPYTDGPPVTLETVNRLRDERP